MKCIVWMAGLSMFMSIAFAQEAIVYRGFAELRTLQNLPQNQWVWEPGETLFQSLVPGTLRLIGVTEQSRLVSSEAEKNPLSAYVGKKVQFFWEGQWREATVVSAERNLFLYEGRYLVGLPGVVAFPDPGGFSVLAGPKLTFRYQGSGNATLAYLTRGITWSLRYTLEDGELTGWASLENNLGRTVKLGVTQLVAGAVPLLEANYSPTPKAAQMEAPAAMRSLDTGAEFVGEAGGVYRYKLPGEVTLEPGITELPFAKSKIAAVYTWTYQSGFNTNNELRFTRGYRFDAPENLAAGVINIRDQGVFVGQTSVSDTSKGNLVQVLLGPDPEGRAERKVEQLARNRFRVTTALKNPKTYAIEVEIYETFPQPFTLEIEGAEKLPEGYRIKFNLKPGESRAVVYIVTLQNR